jgi:uroporphyrinogen-III synthase
MNIKRILISQPKPEHERSPYFDLEKKYGVVVDFRPFVEVEGLPAKEFRKHRVDILSYTAVIMTSKNSIDHFFRICAEMRVIIPETMKYYCISSAMAHYLEKYLHYRKRKIIHTDHTYRELAELIAKKHREEKFLIPCSDAPNEEYTKPLKKDGLRFAKAPMYKGVFSNLTDITLCNYDLLVLFSPAGITSLLISFPDFKQNNLFIATWGEKTALAATNAGFKIQIQAPRPHVTSMAMALDLYLSGKPDISLQSIASTNEKNIKRDKQKKTAKSIA